MNRGQTVRVLVVEDSPVARALMLHLLGTDRQIEVVGTASTGVQALEAADRLRPDVITMDVLMPEMDGLEATRRIMEQRPLPIIIVSGTVQRREVSTTFEALRAGAVAAIPRPCGPGSPDYETSRRELIRTVKAMAEVRLVRRWSGHGSPLPQPTPSPTAPDPKVVAVGASTGGPEALRLLLEGLPPDFPLPLLIVQHMAPGFLSGLTEWLARSTPLPVALARDAETAQGGRIYIAPDDRHLEMDPDLRLHLSSAPPEKGVRPAVGPLFRSVLQSCGRHAVAVLLTGMGRDGVQEMKRLREAGAVTIAQDRASSIIYGMPGEAVREGAALHQLSPPEIAGLLQKIASRRKE